MKAWTVNGIGAPADVLRRVDRDLPTVRPGTLRIRVLVAGVSLPEVLMCRGTYPYKPAIPFTPGHEAVGVILDSAGLAGFEVGQRIMGVTAFTEGRGGHAEEALILGSTASVVPEAMSDEEAAAFTIGYQTAYIGLVVRAELSRGETLLVHGAAGGTGFPAVQLGKALGARVIAVVRGYEKAEACRRDGADFVIDRAECVEGNWQAAVQEAAGAGGIDVVFDPVGGETFRESVKCLGYGGRLVAVGFASGEWGEVPTWELVSRNISLVGVLAFSPDEETSVRMARELSEYYEKGLLEPRITKVHSFEDVPKALTELDERRAIGKHVIRVSDS
jgi:NADPH2:quinone reductase